MPEKMESAFLTQKNLVVRFIENLQLHLLNEFDKEVAELSVSLRKRPSHFQISANGESRQDKILVMEKEALQRQITYSWPGKTPHEAWKFSCILRVLSLIVEAVQNELLITKRSIYYDNPQLFGTQSVVNTIVDDIAYTIGVDRAALRVISVGKGLSAGAFRVMTKAGNHLDMSSEDTLIPRLADISAIDVSEVKWVTIVEKEAVFRRLVHNKHHLNSTAGKGILITGKGYPDLCTREFIHLISDIVIMNSNSNIQGLEFTPPTTPPRFFALVDGDCDGLAIMSTYKYGSMAYAHASANLNAPRLEWLGTRLSDAVMEHNKINDDDWTTIVLSRRDVKKIQSMLMKNPVFNENGPESQWRGELQTMMMLNIKVETEVLYGTTGGLEGWFDRKIESM